MNRYSFGTMLVVDLSVAVHHLNAFTCTKCGMDKAKVCSDMFAIFNMASTFCDAYF